MIEVTPSDLILINCLFAMLSRIEQLPEIHDFAFAAAAGGAQSVRLSKRSDKFIDELAEMYVRNLDKINVESIFISSLAKLRIAEINDSRKESQKPVTEV